MGSPEGPPRTQKTKETKPSGGGQQQKKHLVVRCFDSKLSEVLNKHFEEGYEVVSRNASRWNEDKHYQYGVVVWSVIFKKVE